MNIFYSNKTFVSQINRLAVESTEKRTQNLCCAYHFYPQKTRTEYLRDFFYIGFLFAEYRHMSISPDMEEDNLEYVGAKRATGLFVLFYSSPLRTQNMEKHVKTHLCQRSHNICHNTYYPKIFFLDICSILGTLTGNLNNVCTYLENSYFKL